MALPNYPELPPRKKGPTESIETITHFVVEKDPAFNPVPPDLRKGREETREKPGDVHAQF